MKIFFLEAKVEVFSKPSMGTVEQTITQSQPGRVKFQATYWPARFYNSECQAVVFPDEPVKVIGRQCLTLLVVPVNSRS